MENFNTDQGTLQLLSALGRQGARRLQDFLALCDKRSLHQGTIYIIFQGAEFAGRDDIQETRLEYRYSTDRKILATTKFKSGVVWRRGQLRVPGIKLPETVVSMVKGLKLEELVGGAPLTGFTVNGVVHDAGAKGNLRIRCTAEEVGPIVIDIDSAPEDDPARLRNL